MGAGAGASTTKLNSVEYNKYKILIKPKVIYNA